MPDLPPENVLLVEGQDDAHVVRQLCRRHQSVPEFHIQETGNIDKLLDAIGPAIIVPERRAVGVLVDADDYPERRWNEVRDRFNEDGISIPARPSPNGIVIGVEGRPKIGIWMMPDNDLAGELEDFVEKMIPLNDPVWPLSQRYVDDIPAMHRKFRQGKVLRAKLYAWLAVRKIPGRMGAAIGAGDLNHNAPVCSGFVDWIRLLFS